MRRQMRQQFNIVSNVRRTIGQYNITKNMPNLNSNLNDKRQLFAKFKGKLLHILFCMFCLCCCLWHISSVCKLYFNYETTVTVTFGEQNEMELPATTVCIPHMYAVR